MEGSILTQEALTVAIGEIGKQEDPRGSNWGHPVKDYLLSVGINFPASWCLAFVYWCVNNAASKLGITNPLIKTGSVLHEWENVDHVFKSSTPQKGSIFIMDFGHGLGHTGIVEMVTPGSWLHTIEGNTNDTGSREGFEVCRRLRPVGKCVGFINI